MRPHNAVGALFLGGFDAPERHDAVTARPDYRARREPQSRERTL